MRHRIGLIGCGNIAGTWIRAVDEHPDCPEDDTAVVDTGETVTDTGDPPIEDTAGETGPGVDDSDAAEPADDPSGCCCASPGGPLRSVRWWPLLLTGLVVARRKRSTP